MPGSADPTGAATASPAPSDGEIHPPIHPAVNGSLDRGRLGSPSMTAIISSRPSSITPRQREVVALIAAGCSNDEVGARLGISARTAKAHSDAFRQKLGVTRRRQIPVAYRTLTGDDPLLLHPGAR